MTRIEKLRFEMAKEGIDAVIVSSEYNQLYLSEFSFTDGLLFVTKNSAHLLTDFRYYEMALSLASRDFLVSMPPASERLTFINKIIKDEGIARLGFEGDIVSYQLYLAYKEKFSSVELTSINNMIEKIRVVKSKEEIIKMQRAQDITDSAFSHILNIITPDMTEREVALELDFAMRRLGADGFAFDTIAVSGDASALPHGTARDVKLKPGFLTMDFGARLDGYCSDMTRTIVIGKADDDMKKLYNTVLEAQLRALEFLKCGVDAGEADKVARDIIEAVPEFKGAFGHSLGHSIGLFVHETPGLTPKSFGIKLLTGQVTSVEPGIYLFGKYGCRIEDMVTIEENGVYNFTKSPKDLIEIY